MLTGIAFFGPQITSISTVATGGSISTYTSGGITYQVHRFASIGTQSWTLTSAPTGKTFSYLVVGGGGGAGLYKSGVNFGDGGCGGKVNEGVSASVVPGTYTLFVGDGGQPNTTNTNYGLPQTANSWGQTSSVFNVSARGGIPGRIDGSDGGGDGRTFGTGRLGITSSITGTAVGYGGGGQWTAYNTTALEVMGGGRGQRVSAEQSTVGATATGGGGGASGYSGAPGELTGKRGGSGVVIISFVVD